VMVEIKFKRFKKKTIFNYRMDNLKMPYSVRNHKTRDLQNIYFTRIILFLV